MSPVMIDNEIHNEAVSLISNNEAKAMILSTNDAFGGVDNDGGDNNHRLALEALSSLLTPTRDHHPG